MLLARVAFCKLGRGVVVRVAAATARVGLFGQQAFS